MCEDHTGLEKKAYDRTQLEILGVNVAGRTESEVALLQLIRPRLEAYWEYMHRKANSPWTEDRAYDIVLAVTSSEEQAEQAAIAVQFAKSPSSQES